MCIRPKVKIVNPKLWFSLIVNVRKMFREFQTFNKSIDYWIFNNIRITLVIVLMHGELILRARKPRRSTTECLFRKHLYPRLCVGRTPVDEAATFLSEQNSSLCSSGEPCTEVLMKVVEKAFRKWSVAYLVNIGLSYQCCSPETLMFSF